MTTDLMIKFREDGPAFILTVLELADDGGIMRAFRREFPGPFRARSLPRYTADYRSWTRSTPEELDELRKVRSRMAATARAKTGADARSDPEESNDGPKT